MPFPTSPSNNDVHKVGNRVFAYDSTAGVWDRIAEPPRTAVRADHIVGTFSNQVDYPPGHIIQVIYDDLLYTKGTVSTTDDGTELKCVIIPKRATNYILAEFHTQGANASATYAIRFNLKVTGGGTDGIVGAGNGKEWSGPNANGYGGGRTSAFKAITGGPAQSGAHEAMSYSSSVRFRCNDTVPNWSSGPLTVELMFSTNNASHQANINWAAGADNGTYSANSSRLICYEISG